ncbi:O-methyltransferase [Sediminicoccus sp. BL-A-41-H5]|uniref:O-methyltransferase n=1 Tax=Sediminicoccus sp. BL-A-41-H5 TaxID=3421106 RepID=UPI003D66FB68
MRKKITFIRQQPGWLAANLDRAEFDPDSLDDIQLIEQRATITAETGKHPLWQGYAQLEEYARDKAGMRSANQVRTSTPVGVFYSWLVRQRNSRNVLEFGTAFGQSGMFWLSGLKKTQGHLYTFEPNEGWAALARANLEAVATQFTLTVGTFEENAANVIGNDKIDIALIDAIHTKEFVDAQFSIVMKYMRPGGIVIFDDINFSGGMKDCWRRIANSADVLSSASIGGRCGIVELY